MSKNRKTAEAPSDQRDQPDQPDQSDQPDQPDQPDNSNNSDNGDKSDNGDDLDTPALRSQALRMSYHIARGEVGVLTFEPYKSMLLPYWRFKTPDIARRSSQDLWGKFQWFGGKGDFVGMDMTRKFIQMGMTRAKRYANHKGGQKYGKDVGKDGKKVQLPKSNGHQGQAEKAEASQIFKEVWQQCKADQTYIDLKEQHQAEQKEWKKSHPEDWASHSN